MDKVNLTEEILDQMYTLENALMQSNTDEDTIRAGDIHRMINRLRDLRDDLASEDHIPGPRS
jgi:hypothetical protein